MNNKSKSNIAELLYGKYNYSEKIDFGEKCESLRSKSFELEGCVLDKLKDNAELTELFEKYVESEAVANISENDVHFSEGFKTGLMIGIEAGEWAAEKFKD